METSVPTTKVMSELPSVENTTDTMSEDAEAQTPTEVGTPKVPLSGPSMT